MLKRLVLRQPDGLQTLRISGLNRKAVLGVFVKKAGGMEFWKIRFVTFNEPFLSHVACLQKLL